MGTHVITRGNVHIFFINNFVITAKILNDSRSIQKVSRRVTLKFSFNLKNIKKII